MSDKQTIANEKKRLRAHARALLSGIDPDDRRDWSKRIERHLMRWDRFAVAENVTCYVSTEEEVYTRYLLDLMRVMGKRVYVPVVDKASGELILSRYHGRVELEPSAYGILEPKRETLRPTEPEVIDFALVPGLLFTKYGDRLGHGRGYYDRLLVRLGAEVPKYGLCYSEQVTETLPMTDSDFRLDGIVTEDGIFTAGDRHV